jgi:hypothetical protein
MTPTPQCEVPVLPQAATRLTLCETRQVLSDDLIHDKNFLELVKQYQHESSRNMHTSICNRRTSE